MTDIPFVHISGSGRDRGLQHGRVLKKRVQDTADFYFKSIFSASPLSESEIHERTKRIAEFICSFHEDLNEEINGIADGAGIDPWIIYALNARTEIMNAGVGECTSICFPENSVMGQTWDWVKDLEDLMVILHIESDAAAPILTLTEPGMLGKIGMNKSGIGVCLNFLFSDHALNGVPVHVLIRALLECTDMDEVRLVIEKSGFGKASHLLISDSLGTCFGVEFANGRSAELKPENGALIHTNHCLSKSVSSEEVPNSVERLQHAAKRIESIVNKDMHSLESILLDDSLGECSIHTPYHPKEMLDGVEAGTCATVTMDLKKRKFFCKKGPTRSTHFHEYSF